MSSEPWQIRMYKQREEAHAAQERSLAAAVVTAARTSWYEKANRALPNVKDVERAADVIEADLATFAAQLAAARRERLRELYAAEKKGWQAELAAKGLAIEISRD